MSSNDDKMMNFPVKCRVDRIEHPQYPDTLLYKASNFRRKY